MDEDSGLVHDDKTAGEPFFYDTGEISQSLKDIREFLSQVDRNRAVTNAAVTSLAEAGVITEWSLKTRDGDHEIPVTGLYRIDEAKLNALEDEKILKIRKVGALSIAYAQLLSMNNIQMFAQLAKARAQKRSPDIKPAFGGDDMISFS